MRRLLYIFFFAPKNDTKGWRGDMNEWLCLCEKKRRSRKRRNLILEELIVTCASGGPGYQKTEEHLDILAGH
jgi:hypothetical protein